MVKQIFINLPVKDLEKSKAFFAALGFTFNPAFTDDTAACLVLGKDHYAMLITEPKFKGFSEKEIPDTSNSCEVMNALALESREAVLEMAKKAGAAGAKMLKETDYGWMFSAAFEDMDGHIWEAFFMDESKKPQA